MIKTKSLPKAGATIVSSGYIDKLKKITTRGATSDGLRRTKASSETELRKTTIRQRELDLRKKEAARIASIGVNFDPLDPTLNDVFDKPEYVTPAASVARKAATMETDEIKALRVKASAARAQAGRERQAKLKAERLAAEKAADRRIEEQMERQRVQELIRAERERQEKVAQTRDFALTCQKQLKEREYQKILDEEAKIAEGEQMKLMFKKQEEEARKVEEAKVIAAAKRAEELSAANDKAKARREVRLEEEKARDQEALRYMYMKAEQEKKRVLAEEALKKEKALLQAKLLAQQERVMDTRGEEDARRAQKHQEDAELAARRKVREKEEARRRAAAECDKARKQQMAIKAEMRAREVEKDRELVLRAQVEAARKAAADDEAAERKRLAGIDNHLAIVAQMQAKDRQRMEEASLVYKERQEMMLAEARRARRIAEVREEEKAKLAAEGIDEELQRRAHV